MDCVFSVNLKQMDFTKEITDKFKNVLNIIKDVFISLTNISVNNSCLDLLSPKIKTLNYIDRTNL